MNLYVETAKQQHSLTFLNGNAEVYNYAQIYGDAQASPKTRALPQTCMPL